MFSGLALSVSNIAIMSGASLIGAGTATGLIADSLASETNVVVIDGKNNKVLVRDTTTPSNSVYDSLNNVMTYTSPSAKMRLSSTAGVYKYASHNYCLYSESYNASFWTDYGAYANVSASDVTAPTGFTGAGIKVIGDGTATTNLVATQSGSTVFKNDKIRFKVLAKSSTGYVYIAFANLSIAVNAYFNVSAFTVGTTNNCTCTCADNGDGYALITMVFDLTNQADATGNLILYCAQSGASSLANCDGSHYAYFCGMQISRWPMDDEYVATTSAASFSVPIRHDVSGNALGILAEEQRTNLIYPSTPTAAGWLVVNVTITDSYATGPDGISNSAARLNATSTTRSAYRVVSLAAATKYVISGWVKRTGASDQTFRFYGDTASTGNISGNFTATDTWQRFEFTATTVTGGTQQYGIIRDSSSNDYDILVWGMQVESGADVASSLIVTGTATVTRAIDQISIAASAFNANDTEGTIVCQYQVHATASNADVAKISAVGTNFHVIREVYTGALQCLTYVSGSPTGLVILASSGSADNTEKIVSYAYKQDDFGGSLDGAAALTDTTGAVPSGLATLSVGSSGLSTISYMKYLPRRISDADLATESA